MMLSNYFLWISGTVICVYVLKKLWYIYGFYAKLDKVPGPRGHPLMGNFLQLFTDPENLFTKFRQVSKEYYPIFKLSSFYIVSVALLEPKDVEQILSSTKHLAKSKVYSFLHNWLGTGLLTSTGSKWQQRRKILTPAFHFSILQQYLTVFHEETEEFVKSIQSMEDKSAVNVIPHVARFTLKSIIETAMGASQLDEKSQKEYQGAIHRLGKVLFQRVCKPWLVISNTAYNLTDLGKEEKKLVRTLHKYSRYVISRREKTFDPSALKYGDGSVEIRASKKRRLAMLDLLLAAKAEDGLIDNEGIREEVDTFMFEGHDTTAASISMTLMLLACHRDVQDRIVNEICSVMGEDDRQPTINDLQEMKYLERCIKESLRIYPSVPLITRYCGEEYTTTTGYVIPKDTIIHIHIFDLHRNPETFPDPEKFDPDRFLPENSRDRHPFAYIPFSAGPRNCIGQRFAMLEIKSVLCGVLKNFILEPVDRQEDMGFMSDIILRTKNEVRVKFIQR